MADSKLWDDIKTGDSSEPLVDVSFSVPVDELRQAFNGSAASEAE